MRQMGLEPATYDTPSAAAPPSFVLQEDPEIDNIVSSQRDTFD